MEIIYTEVIYDQIYDCSNDKIFPSQCGIRKGYSSQHSLLVMTEIFKESVDIEAVTQRCFVKKVFLEISQNSQENICARVSFVIKLQI